MTHRRIPIAIPLGAVVLILSCFTWGALSGLERGFFYGVFSNPPTSGFAAYGPNYYQELNTWYFWIVLLTTALIVLALWSSNLGSLLKTLLCCVSIFPYWNMFDFKFTVLGLELCCEYYPWLQTSVYLDMLAAGCIVAILSLELLALVKAGNKLEAIPEIKI